MCGNPLADPRIECINCGEKSSQTVRRDGRFPWRIVPTAFFVLLSGLLFLPVGVALVITVLRTIAEGRGVPPELRLRPVLFAMTAPLTVGLIWASAARFWWKRRWWWAIGASVAGYPVGMLGQWLVRNL
jgi:hypothetical protein